MRSSAKRDPVTSLSFAARRSSLVAAMIGVASLAAFVYPAMPSMARIAPSSSATLISASEFTSGSVGKINGRLFPKRDQGVMTWDGSSAGMPTYRADGSGSFSLTLTVPPSSVGTHTLAAFSKQRGAELVAIAVTVTTTSSSSPTPAPAAAVTPSPTASPSPTATPSPTSPPAPAAADYATRPYTDGSVWNTPIGSGAAYDSHSAQMIATIGLSDNGGVLTSDPTQYTYPVYVATAATPRHTVTTTYNVRRYELDGSYTTLGTSIEVPMAPDWGPSAGTDGQLIVIDSTTGDEYDIWQYAGAGSYRATRLGYYVAGTLRDGAPLDYASRGAGVPYFAGLIRPWEIAQGHIDHAIAFAYQFPAQGRCVAPATKTDGTSTLAMAIPEGARLQLDPSLGAADFDRWALSPTGRIIARAIQRYGLILINVAGRPKLYAENIAANPGAALSWADVGGLSASTVSAIPYTALRVLDLPDGYWTGDAGAPKWDSCYR